MRSVSIVSVGLSKFGEHWNKSFRELIAEAGIEALQNASLAGEQIQAIYGGCMASGLLIGQEHIGALIADQLGLNPIPATRVEGACASGSLALRTGYTAIASGQYDCVAVGGVEKMTEVSTEKVTVALGGAGDQETELFHGATFPSLYALLARRHMKEYETTEEELASVAVKNHFNATMNPKAQFQRKITIEQVMNSGYVASPLKLLDCSPITDGAAVMILMETSKAKKITDKAIEIIGSVQTSDTLAIADRKSLTELNATKIAAKQLFQQTNLTPRDIDFAEVHDCFTINEILAIEDIGFFKKGEGGKASIEGKTALNGEIPINTSGGLKAKGHPVGATGIAQAIEAFYQLNNMAGERQVKNAEIGLTHNVGGSGATVVMHAFRRAR